MDKNHLFTFLSPLDQGEFMFQQEKSVALFQEAKKYMPGGVNSPVRAFRAVQGDPIFFDRGEGAYLYDVDGNKYIDCVNSWGPLILGYSPPRVIKAIQEEAEKATSFGAPTKLEIELTRLITEVVPSIEMVRMVNSGTEATMSAIRVARAFTGRTKIIKFSGCYHGHGDSFLIQAGSGATTLGSPNSPGVTPSVAADTIIVPFNDIEAIERAYQEFPEDIAGVIAEPVAANMGLVLPQDNFLQKLREVTKKYGSLLILDEVMTGFRLALGGAQEVFDVQPDLTTLGKIIGGGLPVGAYGGRRDIMETVAPLGPVYQAGTLSGNPLAMRAGLETLLSLKEDENFYQKLDEKGAYLEEAIQKDIAKHDYPVHYLRIGSMSCLYFRKEAVRNYEDACASDTTKFGEYFWAMLKEGVYLPPAQFEAVFLSRATEKEELDHIIAASSRSLAKVFS